jgi:pyridinium-3,5-bisthiocarboxylic acid mononucleotide nickel chelatase
MRIAYLDCFSGISGDMFLAALIANGLDSAALEVEIRKLGIDIRVRTERVQRGMLIAEHVTIEAPPQHHHRHYTDIVAKITAAPLSALTKQRAQAVFERLGRAEAKIHNVPLDRVHFHEVGALDSMADIVGACAGLEMLGIDDLRCSPLNVGGGTVRCDHGVLPVPAPATAELLQGIPVYSSGIQAELVTPTGAALVAVLASGFGPLPAMTVQSSGYGAGTRDLGEFPNVLRMFLGEPIRAGSVSDRTPREGSDSLETLLMLETNLDDMNPQLCAFFAERAFAAGALDVFFAPVQMKKNRPGVLLSVLCRPEQRDALMDLFFQETTTLGVRCHEVLRRALARELIAVQTSYGEVRVKVSRSNGRILNFSPEFEDCRRLAAAASVPLKTVMQEATFAFWKESAHD